MKKMEKVVSFLLKTPGVVDVIAVSLVVGFTLIIFLARSLGMLGR